jgi:hypothetical protein
VSDERFSLKDIRREAETAIGRKTWVTPHELLAFVEAVEAARRVHDGWESGDFDMNDLAAALARFKDFSA